MRFPFKWYLFRGHVSFGGGVVFWLPTSVFFAREICRCDDRADLSQFGKVGSSENYFRVAGRDSKRGRWKNSSAVDGWNSAPLELGSLSHYLRLVLHFPGGCLGFLKISHSSNVYKGFVWIYLQLVEEFLPLENRPIAPKQRIASQPVLSGAVCSGSLQSESSAQDGIVITRIITFYRQFIATSAKVTQKV